MNAQDFTVGVIVTTAFLYLLTCLAPERWRGKICARLGRVARDPSCGGVTRWLATRLGRALAPPVGCEGCARRSRSTSLEARTGG